MADATIPDETPEFWLNMPHEQVAEHAARFSKIHRQYPYELGIARMIATRLTMSAWLHGSGIEVGAGSQPYPVRDDLKVLYGDIRNESGLKKYFGDAMPLFGGDTKLDAQTFAGIPDQSVDFVITSHVIEHLFDPVGSIEQTMRIIKPGGTYLLAVPDMRFTFDQKRPETTLDHVLRDYRDGGEGTKIQAYEEIAQFVHGHTPEEAQAYAPRNMAAGMDIHVHAWTHDGFQRLLENCARMFPLKIEAGIRNNNENIFALRRL
jgi:SAM-dependent methyltransferase